MSVSHFVNIPSAGLGSVTNVLQCWRLTFFARFVVHLLFSIIAKFYFLSLTDVNLTTDVMFLEHVVLLSNLKIFVFHNGLYIMTITSQISGFDVYLYFWIYVTLCCLSFIFI